MFQSACCGLKASCNGQGEAVFTYRTVREKKFVAISYMKCELYIEEPNIEECLLHKPKMSVNASVQPLPGI